MAGELAGPTEEEPMRGTASAAGRTKKLRRRLELVKGIDFFDAPGRDEAERAVSDAESRPRGGGAPRSTEAPETATPRRRVWVTRKGVKVDRMASAWLIRRFLDPEATFKFVAARGYEPGEDEIRFDMFDGEFTHEGDRCTFEILLERFAMRDPALVAVGEIVHDIDCKDEKFGRPQAAGVASLIDGITRVEEDDGERLRRGAELFDGLYEHLRFT
jgi:hypothetical protein